MKKEFRHCGSGKLVLAIGLTLLGGCRSTETKRPQPRPMLGENEPTAKVTPSQIADVQIAMGRSAEKQGDVDQAIAAYQEALKRDKSRSDAYVRIASLKSRQGKFEESDQLYRHALEIDRGNPDIYCDMGYSLYLRRRWAEAEMNLRQSIAIRPDHSRAHNNLGSVLAHNLRTEEALVEFRKAGCGSADSHNNLAIALTLDRRWSEAREQYRLALTADPTSQVAKTRLAELETLVAKVDPAGRNGLQDTKILPASARRDPVVPNALLDTKILPASARRDPVVPNALQDTKILPASASLPVSRHVAPRRGPNARIIGVGLTSDAAIVPW